MSVSFPRAYVEKISGSRPVEYAIIYGGVAENGTFVDYADLIHDWLGHRNWQRPGSGPKFVEAHVDRRNSEFHLNMDVVLKNLVRKVGL